MPNFIYKFINYENEIIYVGKTSDIKKRMKQHFSSQAHLPKECYDQVYKIYFANVNSKYNAELLETFFINKYTPKYNTDKNYKKDDEDLELKVIEPQWKELWFLKIKTKNNLPNIEFLETYPPYINRRLMSPECMKKAFEYNFRKIECYNYEFEHFCPNITKILGIKQIKKLYEYAQQHINNTESNIDEYIGATPDQQFEDNYIAFNLDKIKEVSKIIPDFNLMLKYGLVENLGEDIFIVHFLTPKFLKTIEDNYKKTKI